MRYIHASRTTLFAANAESKFFRQGAENGDDVSGMAAAAISRRAAESAADVPTKQGLLAARRAGIGMLREYGLEVGDNEELGGTRFELMVAPSAEGMSDQVGRMEPLQGRAGGPSVFDPDRVDRAVEEASRVLGEVGSSTGGASTNSSNEPRGGAGAAPDLMGESVNADRLTQVTRELSETERALERLGAMLDRNAESLGASTNALRLSMEEKETRCSC